ncbi:MAG: 2-methylfumaryl-CoA isomerase [Rhodospirillaceae bacterium]|nr:2-methylfumaryl-CoA isomerase [Rhodospirillaceae bacterium]
MYDLLSDLTIIEGSAFVAAPLGGMTLAQLGAEVIRFDPIGGGMDYKRWPLDDKGNSLYWAGLNKGKKSIAINTREEEGRELIKALICQSGAGNGIFLTNYPPGGPFSFDKLKAEREDLIMLNILGSHDGSPAVDYTINCALGYPLATGPRNNESAVVNHVLPAWDLVTGTMAATGILAAERKRNRLGNGQLITLSLSDVGIWVASALGHLAESELMGRSRSADGNHIYGAFGHDFLTKDDRRIMLTALTKAQWRRLKKAVNIEEGSALIESSLGIDLDEEGARYSVRDEIVSLIEPYIRTRDYNVVKDILDANGVLWGPYQTFDELVKKDPRCSIENPLVQKILQKPIGSFPAAGSPLRFQAIENQSIRPAPVLGENTDEVISNILNLPSHTIAELHDKGIISGATA